mgnify:CR=1 FL=1
MSDSKSDSAHDESHRIAGGMIALLWVLVLGGGTWLVQGWMDSRNADRAARWTTDESGQQQLVLKADRYGQFVLDGSTNNRPTAFLIDTGASGISIPGAVADALDLPRGRSFEVMTANGSTRVYRTRLDSLSIGPFTRYDVTAHINPALAGDTALLGMNFLRHYELLHRRGELIISQPAQGDR